ncbi:MAG: hypothetical protein JWP45_2900 [Mucilaginibacter sp.]|nr:hypothetical protein [Mucilaginibacter sp.]
MKTKDRTRTIPMSIFTEAALTYFKCQAEYIEIRMIAENKEAFMVYNEQGYKISTREKLLEDVELQLTDKDAAHQIDFWCWIEATKHTVKMNRILVPLVRAIQDIEQAKMLLIALGIEAYTDDDEVVFWEILSRIDKDGDLLGTAMVITAQVYNGLGLIDDLTDLQIMYGSRVYNPFERGIFETVYAADQHRDFEFYLYSTDFYLPGK